MLTVSLMPALAGLVAALVLGLDGGALQRVLATPGVGLSIGTSLWTGIAATVLSLLIAHFAVAAAFTGRWRTRLTALSLPLLTIPHLAIGIGLALVIAPSGLLMRLLSPGATGLERPPDWLLVQDPLGLSMIGGLVLKESCFLILILSVALAQVPATRLLQQARTLGYGPLQAWLSVVAPALQRQIRVPLAAVLVFGISNVEMAIPLGPDLPPTFSVLLWRWFTDPDAMIHAQAYTGSLLLLLINVLALVGFFTAGGAFRFFWRRESERGQRRRCEAPQRIGIGVGLTVGWVIGTLAIVALFLRAAAGAWPFPSVLPALQHGETLRDVLQSILPVARSVAGSTLLLATGTAFVTTLLILPAAEKAAHDTRLRGNIGALLFLPLLVPQMTFLFGVQVLLTRMGLDGTYAGVLWSHAIFALPYVWGIVASARSAIDPRYDAVSRTLGASTLKTYLQVSVPLLARTLLLAIALAFAVSVALYLPTLFVGAGRIATAATEAAAASGSGSSRLAAVHAMLLAAAPLAAFALAYGIAATLFRSRTGVPR